jgi:hypothetical protein
MRYIKALQGIRNLGTLDRNEVYKLLVAAKVVTHDDAQIILDKLDLTKVYMG